MLQEEMDKRLIQLAKKMGKDNASQLLSVLGKDKSFLSALETEVGQELLRDAVSSVEHIIGLILNEKEDDKDKADLRAYLSIIKRWQGRINQYYKNQEKFIKKSG